MKEKQNEAKKIEAKDLRCQDRQKLEKIIPLSTPYVVYIDPTNLCNFKCSFCPTGDPKLLKEVGRPHASINLELFKKIIDDISQFDEKLKLLSLYKDGEPLLNHELPQMIKYAKHANIAEKIWTKTNGSLLSPTLNTQLIDAGLDMIHISVESVSSDGYMNIANVKIDYDAFKANIQDFYEKRGDCKVYIKIIDCNLSMSEKERFFDDFQPIADFVSIENLMGWSYSSIKDFTLGIQSDTYDGLPLIQKKVCAYPFYVLAINADASISLCGNDWAYETIVGNVASESLKDIWKGEKLYQFRKMMLENRRYENKACADCYYLQIVPDNIDDYADDILSNIEEARCLK